MEELLNLFANPHSSTTTLCLLGLATMRIWLEIIGYDFGKLPITSKIANIRGENFSKNIHKMGLIASVGYIVLFAPSVLLG